MELFETEVKHIPDINILLNANRSLEDKVMPESALVKPELNKFNDI